MSISLSILFLQLIAIDLKVQEVCCLCPKLACTANVTRVMIEHSTFPYEGRSALIQHSNNMDAYI